MTDPSTPPNSATFQEQMRPILERARDLINVTLANPFPPSLANLDKTTKER